jgi:pimeloyl-ACP methyl ester carboxylesterase
MDVVGAATRDAVVVIPGIMGSKLVEVESNDALWGLDKAGWFLSAWTTGEALRRLEVTDEERAGRSDRIKAVGLLRAPAFAPVLKGFEPYTDLLTGIGRALAHKEALCEFPYDWRLSVEHNAGQLARLVDWHLSRWRAHPSGSADANVVLVAHSMGGLVARYFTHVLGGASDVRTTVTLGTPYYGAVKAAYILSAGRGAPVPLPRKRLRKLVQHMPGLYDLLPFYRCVDEGATARWLQPGDIKDLDGDPELAAESLDRHNKLIAGDAGSLRLLIGVEQPTMQSVSMRDGVATPLQHTCLTDEDGVIEQRMDLGGDGTVFRRSAAAFGLAPGTLPQSHGAVAATEEAISHVRDVLTNDTAGPPLGTGEIGVDMPDVVSVKEPLTITVTGADISGTSCRVFDAFSGRQVAWPPLQRADRVVTASVDLPEPGVYRVEVKGGGASAVSEQVMAVSPEDYP